MLIVWLNRWFKIKLGSDLDKEFEDATTCDCCQAKKERLYQCKPSQVDVEGYWCKDCIDLYIGMDSSKIFEKGKKG